MGVLWTTYPLDDEMKEWLDSVEVPYPQVSSRFPKGSEVKNAVSRLDEYNVKILDNGVGHSWQASVESKENPEEFWTLLNITEYTGDEEFQEPWFEKGHEELIKVVLREICKECGPMVLIPDTGDTPEVINA